MTILVNVNIQYVDESGAPYAAGLYYFGDPDTDPVANPKAVFSDPDLQIELPNPQVLNARGAFQQPIYRPSSDYSHQLNDVLVNQIFLVSNDSGQAATPSDRIQDNASDTTIVDEMGGVGLFLTSLSNPDPTVAGFGTRLAHGGDSFIRGDDFNTTLFDTSGNVVFNASQTLTVIGSTLSNPDPLRISVDDLKMFAPGADDAMHSLEITSGQTNLGTDGNLNAIEITDARVRIVAATDNGIAFESVAGTTKLGTAANVNAFVINQTEVIIRNPLASGTEAIRVIDGLTTISANTNEDAISVLTGSMTLDTAGPLSLIGTTTASLAAQAGIATITGSTDVDINATAGEINLVAQTGIDLTTATGEINLVATTGGFSINAQSGNSFIAAGEDFQLTSQDIRFLMVTNATDKFIRIETPRSDIGAPFRFIKDSADLAANDKFIQFIRAKDSTFNNCGGIQSNASNTPTFFNISDRRLKSNYVPVENMLAKIRNVPVYQGDLVSDLEGGNKVNTIYWIADEMAAEFPGRVSGIPNEVDDDGNPVFQTLSVGSDLELWAALSEAATLIEDLETRLSDLEAA